MHGENKSRVNANNPEAPESPALRFKCQWSVFLNTKEAGHSWVSLNLLFVEGVQQYCKFSMLFRPCFQISDHNIPIIL